MTEVPRIPIPEYYLGKNISHDQQEDFCKVVPAEKEEALTCPHCEGRKIEPVGYSGYQTDGRFHWYERYVMRECKRCKGKGELEDTLTNRFTLAFSRKMREQWWEAVSAETKVHFTTK